MTLDHYLKWNLSVHGKGKRKTQNSEKKKIVFKYSLNETANNAISKKGQTVKAPTNWI